MVETKRGRPYKVPIRIYAFAKELGLDNKDLLDICTKAGINGKGSALASLSDEEVAKVKKVLDSKNQSEPAQAKASSGTSAPVMERPRSPLDVTTRSKPRVLDRPKKSPRATEDTPVEEKQVEETPTPAPREDAAVKEVTSQAEAPASPKAPEPTSDSSSSAPAKKPLDIMRKRSPLGGRSDQMIRNLDMRRKKNDDQPRQGGDDRERRERPKSPGVRVAAMPKVKQPTPGETKTEEKVIKPDLALPQDAIQKVKRHGGAALPLGAFTESAKKGKKGGPGAGPGPGKDAPGEVGRVDDGNDRRRRGKSRNERSDEVDATTTSQGGSRCR